MSLGDVFPAANIAPLLPFVAVFREVNGDFFDQNIDGLKSASRMLSHHDRKLLQPLFPGLQISSMRKTQVGQHRKKNGEGAAQGNNQRKFFRFSLDHFDDGASKTVAIQCSGRAAINFDDALRALSGNGKTVADEQAARFHFLLQFFP